MRIRCTRCFFTAFLLPSVIDPSACKREAAHSCPSESQGPWQMLRNNTGSYGILMAQERGQNSDLGWGGEFHELREEQGETDDRDHTGGAQGREMQQ